MFVKRKSPLFTYIVTGVFLRARAQIVFTNPYDPYNSIARDVDPTDTSRRRRVRPDWQRS